MNLSEWLCEHKAEKGAVRQVLEPYVRLLAWFYYGGGKEGDVRFDPRMPLSARLDFDRFEFQNADRSIVYHFDVYRYDDCMQCAVADHYTYAIPIGWLDLSFGELTEKLRPISAREKASGHREAEAEEAAHFATAFLPEKGYFAHLRLGMEFGNKGDWDGAIAEYREALRLNPRNADAHANLGGTMGNKGNWDGAMAECREALRLNPNHAEAHHLFGTALGNRGDWDGAMAEYREALRLNPRNADAHVHHGVALGQKGDLNGAIAEYREALLLNPHNVAAHANLGGALAIKGDLGGAIAELREALRLNPNHARAHYVCGVMLERQSNYEGALREYRVAINLDPQNPEYRKNCDRLSWAIPPEDTPLS